MVNLKKYNGFLKLFVIFLTLFFTTSCSKHNYSITKVEGKVIPITEKQNIDTDIEFFLKPYKERIEKDLNEVLAYCPETMDKNNGQWQTTIGNLIADISLKKGDSVFYMREKKHIDLCLLNYGGIRSTLSKGNVTPRTAFEIMPFENNLVVVTLKGKQILELVTYFIAAKKPHPLAGITFTIDKNNSPKNIIIQGKNFDPKNDYYVATNDYLSNGGDNMIFFQKGIQKFELNYKLRNILIDYFRETAIIAVPKDIRIIQE
jgi:2',3'-cyclic-nucleotide 2'-phosphodiesterase (5'-nucleotidase family)